MQEVEVEVEVVAEATNVGSNQWMQKDIVFISIGKEKCFGSAKSEITFQ